jgi:hypothetical protein
MIKEGTKMKSKNLFTKFSFIALLGDTSIVDMIIKRFSMRIIECESDIELGYYTVIGSIHDVKRLKNILKNLSEHVYE